MNKHYRVSRSIVPCCAAALRSGSTAALSCGTASIISPTFASASASSVSTSGATATWMTAALSAQV